MSEPVEAVAVHAGGGIASGMLSLFGVATGLHPVLLVFGMAGGWWALSNLPPMTLVDRIKAIILSGLLGALLSPIAAEGAASFIKIPASVTAEMIAFPSSMIIGFLTYTVFAPSFIELAKRFLSGFSGSSEK